MGPKSFQSSFIPKGSEGGSIEQVFQKKKTSGFGVLIVSVFIIVLLITIGIFGYKWVTKNAIESLNTELALAEESIDTETIDTMVAFSKKLAAAREVVMKHRAVSNFLTLLSDNTLQSIAFDDFSYNLRGDGQLEVKLKGKALNYGSIALEDSLLSELKELKSIKFGDLSLVEGGRVSFGLDIIVDPSSAIYSPSELSVPAIEDEDNL